jgi:hypothetical protein
MTKKQTEVLEATPIHDPLAGVDIPERNEKWDRESALNHALTHHKINGGMLTVAQLIDNAKQFNAYITGETK